MIFGAQIRKYTLENRMIDGNGMVLVTIEKCGDRSEWYANNSSIDERFHRVCRSVVILLIIKSD